MLTAAQGNEGNEGNEGILLALRGTGMEIPGRAAKAFQRPCGLQTARGAWAPARLPPPPPLYEHGIRPYGIYAATVLPHCAKGFYPAHCPSRRCRTGTPHTPAARAAARHWLAFAVNRQRGFGPPRAASPRPFSRGASAVQIPAARGRFSPPPFSNPQPP